MHALANPTRFLRLADFVLPWAIGICLLSFATGLFYALVISPPDYQQGESVRIMYVHVPSAWMGLFIYSTIAIASAMFLIWRHPVANLIARSSAPVGAMFTAVCLLSGMLWGKPMWGTPWVWDARLTSMLILLFLYLGYMALADAFETPERGDKAAAILALVGSVNLPIIKFSVDWWNTLHQPSIISMSGFSVNTAMLAPLLIMLLAFKSYYIAILLKKVRSEFLNAKLRALRLAQIRA